MDHNLIETSDHILSDGDITILNATEIYSGIR